MELAIIQDIAREFNNGLNEISDELRDRIIKNNYYEDIENFCQKLPVDETDRFNEFKNNSILKVRKALYDDYIEKGENVSISEILDKRWAVLDQSKGKMRHVYYILSKKLNEQPGQDSELMTYILQKIKDDPLKLGIYTPTDFYGENLKLLKSTLPHIAPACCNAILGTNNDALLTERLSKDDAGFFLYNLFALIICYQDGEDKQNEVQGLDGKISECANEEQCYLKYIEAVHMKLISGSYMDKKHCEDIMKSMWDAGLPDQQQIVTQFSQFHSKIESYMNNQEGNQKAKKKLYRKS
ncbi:hypothetical protein Cyrtocomes_00514 [Candidatus Cyrtobacter comes]|uniref:Uncharacterized protein n=1 Tax=Candidatus Cyrtobacter comes TaxID=675776 RepID=A0ABU5L7N6_9RICK|nr:hypothetical protein [Candidatus Cyrtobacter comes]MDZ5762143.1 hypothetical protein [Candidatus Cyrtobacter comes]